MVYHQGDFEKIVLATAIRHLKEEANKEIENITE
jgi:hypothetical protein